MQPPIIGIFCSCLERLSGGQPVSSIFLNTAYCRAVTAAGGLPLLLPPFGASAPQLLPLCSGLLLPGGDDLDPRFYGQPPHPLLGEVSLEIDLCELELFRLARTRGLPVLGICRGMQLVNVALGGTLHQDNSLFPVPPLPHVQHRPRSEPTHRIAIEQGSLLHRLLGADTAETNSMHHQCVALPGAGLRVTARTAEGIPEAMESDDGILLLIQWHPEELANTTPAMAQIFAELVRRAGADTARKNTE